MGSPKCSQCSAFSGIGTIQNNHLHQQTVEVRTRLQKTSLDQSFAPAFHKKFVSGFVRSAVNDCNLRSKLLKRKWRQ